jgi:hypothetical protein
MPGIIIGTALSAVAGALAGGVTGGLAGKTAAEAVAPAPEELFWRDAYHREPYYVAGRNFEYYAPGFRAGWSGRVRHDGRSFDEAEPDLIAEYGLSRSELDPAWHDIRPAAQAAWDRVDRSRKENPSPG